MRVSLHGCVGPFGLAFRLIRFALIGSCVVACSTGSTTSTPKTARALMDDFNRASSSIHPCDATEVAALLCGHFASTAQSKADSEYFDVRLHMVQIWHSRSDAIWLYVEQAMESAPCKPYRQRIYRITEGRLVDENSEVLSQVFEMPDAGAFICAWAAPDRFDALDPAKLTEREGCRITLRKTNGVWRGSTDGQSCLSALRGATFATSEVLLVPERIETWDRGFDAEGKQVWGARKGPYIFDRLGKTPANPCTNPSVAASAGQ